MAILFPFGKYQGKTPQEIAESGDRGYLEWALAMDIPERYPDLGREIRSVLETPPDLDLTLVPREAPALEARVRGRGQMVEGTTLHPVTPQGFADHAITTKDGRSTSGKSGWVLYEDTPPDGVYVLRTCTGSIARPLVTEEYVCIRDGRWHHLVTQTRDAAVTLVRGNDSHHM